jgi:DNA-binding HxlR family transcriptional regulator
MTMKQVDQQSVATLRKAIQLVSKKLSFPIISQLHYGPMRFNKLKQKFSEESITSLRDTLLHLENHKMIKREIYAKKPVRMKYSLTKEGIQFIQTLLGIRKWSD